VSALLSRPERPRREPRLLTRVVRTWVDVRCEQPGTASLTLVLRAAPEGALVHWEVALDRAFKQRERYGLLRAPQSGRLRIALSGLAPGCMYWFRVQSEQRERGVVGSFQTRSHKALRARPLTAFPRASRDYAAITPA
jgi:phosphodiesterase/alkaline phosphatase D-like protein